MIPAAFIAGAPALIVSLVVSLVTAQLKEVRYASAAKKRHPRWRKLRQGSEAPRYPRTSDNRLLQAFRISGALVASVPPALVLLGIVPLDATLWQLSAMLAAITCVAALFYLTRACIAQAPRQHSPGKGHLSRAGAPSEERNSSRREFPDGKADFSDVNGSITKASSVQETLRHGDRALLGEVPGTRGRTVWVAGIAVLSSFAAMQPGLEALRASLADPGLLGIAGAAAGLISAAIVGRLLARSLKTAHAALVAAVAFSMTANAFHFATTACIPLPEGPAFEIGSNSLDPGAAGWGSIVGNLAKLAGFRPQAFAVQLALALAVGLAFAASSILSARRSQ